MSKETPKTFKAKVNVNFSVSLMSYAKTKEILEKQVESLSQYEATGMKLPVTTQMAYRTFRVGQVLTFGDNLECNVTDDGFMITVYPKELYEQQSKRFVDMPCKIQGNVIKSFNDAYANLPFEEQESLKRKYDDLTARFHKTPVMSLVA
jgi:hypothetical protein